jgi:hypothetical protein
MKWFDKRQTQSPTWDVLFNPFRAKLGMVGSYSPSCRWHTIWFAVKAPNWWHICSSCWKHLGGSINAGTPKWMVYKGNPIEMDDLGVPPFMETPIFPLSATQPQLVPGVKAAHASARPMASPSPASQALLGVWPGFRCRGQSFRPSRMGI